jgi:hypothetical protein
MMKRTITAADIACGMTAGAGRADAWYQQPYYGYSYDPGPAIALGIFGTIAGAAIASQGGWYAYGPPVYPVYPVYGARCSPVPIYDSWGNFAGYRTACW